jgi:hypothetical protein
VIWEVSTRRVTVQESSVHRVAKFLAGPALNSTTVFNGSQLHEREAKPLDDGRHTPLM